MNIFTKIYPRIYMDSLKLMRESSIISKLPGIEEAGIFMGTDANIQMLKEIGLYTNELIDARPDDLLIVIEAENEKSAKTAFEEVESALLGKGDHKVSTSIGGTKEFYSLNEARRQNPDSNLVIVSVPGKYAAKEARKAIELGMNVMIFSDNVTLEDEIKLKKFAESKGLIVMGPDCGTSIIDGTGLCFANKIRRGNIGIVGAAGTGIQEICVLIDRMGGGISHAIGTGGRDLSVEVGGISMKKGIEILENDPNTSIIILVAKSANQNVSRKIYEIGKTLSKPIINAFLGDEQVQYELNNHFSVSSLEQAAVMAVELSKIKHLKSRERFQEELSEARNVAALKTGISEELKEKLSMNITSLGSGQKYFRGLYCGGTLAFEATCILHDTFEICSNLSYKGMEKVTNFITSNGNVIIDLGADEFTQGRAHPMIDPYMRNLMVERYLGNKDVAVIFFDIVLGYGSHLEPCLELTKIIKSSKERKIFLAHVCGTESDPQKLSRQQEMLIDAGVFVLESNAQMAKTVSWISKQINKGENKNG